METKLEPIKTKRKISTNDSCKQCPLRLFSKPDDVIELGFGNIYSNVMFVLPSYFYVNNNLLELFIKSYEDITNKNILEEVYVTRLCKCYCKTLHIVEEDGIRFCNYFINYEITKQLPKHIVFFGDTYWKLFPYITKNIFNTHIHIVQNPIVLKYDNEDIKNKYIKNFKYVLSKIQ